MNNIQQATTLVAPTGTGKLFVPYSSDADSATYIEQSPTGRASTLKITRIRPKPQGTFAGVDRYEWRMTEYFTVGTTEHPVVTYGGSSMPVAVSPSDRANCANRAAIMARDPVNITGMSTGIIPL